MTVYLPLSAGRMVKLGSLLRVEIAFLSAMVILEGGIFALARVADTWSQICSASEELSLLILIADSVMRSTIGSCRWGDGEVQAYAQYISFWFCEGPVQ